MRLEHFRGVHLFVAQHCFAKDLRLQLKLDKLLHAPALHEDLGPFLVNRDAQLVLLCEKNRPLLRHELESKLREQRAQLAHLIVGERMRV